MENEYAEKDIINSINDLDQYYPLSFDKKEEHYQEILKNIMVDW